MPAHSLLKLCHRVALVCTWVTLTIIVGTTCATASQEPAQKLTDAFTSNIQPILKKYCLSCHSTADKKGSLDLERFTNLDHLRQDIKPWQNMIEQIETGEMPPKKKPQPTEAEKKQLITWVKTFLDHEARSRANDPGHVPLRRLSNAEYDYTIHDLTGVDLKPTREFPPDGAAGEGFTNAAEALTEISPALMAKYLKCAKDITEHVVLTPDGFRFSPSKTRRDWTDEGTRKLQQFYSSIVPADGKLPIQSYLAATIKHRDALANGKTNLADVASNEKLNPKYLGILWTALRNTTPNLVLDPIRQQWAIATVHDVPALLTSIQRQQNTLWKTVNVANYYQSTSAGYAESTSRQQAVDPSAVDTLSLRLGIKPVPGQNDVTIYLNARDLLPTTSEAKVVWKQLRLEAAGKPALLLANYSDYHRDYAVDYASVFANTASYLQAVAARSENPKLTVQELAKQHQLDAEHLARWVEVLALDADKIGRVVPMVALKTLDEKLERSANKAWINGWKKRGQELPILVTNSSDTEEHIPGRSAPHSVTVHPMPAEFVGIVWKSPVAGKASISARITSAHAACGNGVGWWLEHRHADRAVMFSEGSIGVGGEAKPSGKEVTLAAGDQIMLAIDAKNNDHGCDLTDIALTIQVGSQTWNLASDVANNILEGNPHADKLGHTDIWSFVYGPARAVKSTTSAIIPPGSLLDRWRTLATKADKQTEATALAKDVQTLLSGKRPGKDKDVNSLLYDNLLALDGPLFRGTAPIHIGKLPANAATYGLSRERFNAGNLVADTSRTIELRLPAALLLGRELVAEATLEKPSDTRVVQFQLLTSPPSPTASWDGKTALVAVKDGAGLKQLLASHAAFRDLFPIFLCYPTVIPNDEVVSLKMFHREDEPLNRLFLNDKQLEQVNHWWLEHQFVSKQAVAEYAYLPQFIGFVSQDGAPGMLEYFKAQLPIFKKRADAADKLEEAAIPKQLDQLLTFASQTYRRPLTSHEQTELRSLYQSLRSKNVTHDEAIRGVLTKIFIAPSFLFRIEQETPSQHPHAVSDHELANRLSYFLWSSAPDETLRQLAASGTLHQEDILKQQLHRMLQHPRLRRLAIEFGTQWIHVRGFDDLKEKNEKLFPMFDARLREAIYEESILFFQDLFQANRPVTSLLDADATFLNERLAKHYGIPNITGEHFRRVTGIKQYGRGGILGLASVQTKEAGASRTSPILRGNWVVETLLGEKLPKPPPNVPQLPEQEGMDKLTMRQLVEKHTSNAGCASCHQRIDPFGFALEKFDPIGRRRTNDLGGFPVDAKAVMKDGSTFDDIDGLRNYLLSRKKDVVVRLFCQRLLGYALGRMTTLSDTALLDQMVEALHRNEGRVAAALEVLVMSPQFRMKRGVAAE